jgi:AraC-like DNA-binding protein
MTSVVELVAHRENHLLQAIAPGGCAPRIAPVVLIAHSIPLVSAGLASTLRLLPACIVQIWDSLHGPWHLSSQHLQADIVVSDSVRLPEQFANVQALDSFTASAPLVVLVTNASIEADEENSDVSACLSISSSEEEVLATLRHLMGNSAQDDSPATAIPTAAALDNMMERPFNSTLRALSPENAPPRGGLAPGALKRIREHVEKGLAEKINVCELAALVGLSESHFSRAFKQSVGQSPHRYLLLRRIAAAAELIEKTDRHLSEIALNAGFSGQCHFTRMFVRETGETPLAFRKRYR